MFGDIFNVLFVVLATALSWCYAIGFHNYAIAIVLFTVLFAAITYPLSAKQIRSMIVMQKIQPELKKLQEIHKDDRETFNQELMALYKRHNINPLSGCWPLLLQYPLMIVLFQILRGLTNTVYPKNVTAGMGKAVEALTTGNAIPVEAVPKYLPHGSAMFHDLQAAGGKMVAFGFDFANKASDFKLLSLAALPFLILIALSAATQWISMKQIYKRQTSPQNNQMVMMNRLMIPLFAWFGLHFQAALLLYWVSSGALRIAQQEVIYKYDPKLRQLSEETEGDLLKVEAEDRKRNKQARANARLGRANGKGKGNKKGKR